MERKIIMSQITMEALLEGHLKNGDSVREKRDKKNRLTRLGIFRHVSGKSEPKVTLEYLWRPNAV